MKTLLTTLVILTLSVLAGCGSPVREKELLTVDFQKDQTLRYEFVSNRDTEVIWEPVKKGPDPAKSTVDKFSETLRIVVAYTPIETDPYGLTTIKATCESVNFDRTGSRSRQGAKNDAVESLVGKTFTFTVGPTGKIKDYSQLDKLIRETGEKAFRSRNDVGKIKDPDMVNDFAATQWFLWDSVSSIKKAAEGLAIGQTWHSKLPMPNPMLLSNTRDVTYTLAEIRQTEKGKVAVIRSSYSLAESIPDNWPKPYPDGTFQMSGTFGFLRNYKVLDLQGQGQEEFNIDKGRVEQYLQNYQVRLEASVLLIPNVNPNIIIKQTLTMKLLEQGQN